MPELSPYESRIDSIKDEKKHKKITEKRLLPYAVTYTHAHASIFEE